MSRTDSLQVPEILLPLPLNSGVMHTYSMPDFLALGAGDSHPSPHACLASPLPVNHLPSSVLSHNVSPVFNGILLLCNLEPRLYQTPQADPSPGQECLPHLV